MSKKDDERRLRTDLTVLERLEILERKVFNIDKCDLCNKYFDVGVVSRNHSYGNNPLCCWCFWKLLEENKE